MAPSLTVACLCAAWCDACRAWRAAFDALGTRLATSDVRLLWIDIEDEAELVGELEVENFPSVLVARGATPLFVGAVLPQPALLGRLIERALAGELAPLADAPDAALLAARLAARLGA